MPMFPEDAGECQDCKCGIGNHCSDDNWCFKCKEVGHNIKIVEKYKDVRFG